MQEMFYKKKKDINDQCLCYIMVMYLLRTKLRSEIKILFYKIIFLTPLYLIKF